MEWKPKILDAEQIAALARLLGEPVKEVEEIVPPAGGEFITLQWAFVGCMMTAAFKAGYGLRIEVECRDNVTKFGLSKWCVQAFHLDGSPTGVADEVRCAEKDEDLGRIVALVLLDLVPKNGGV